MDGGEVELLAAEVALRHQPHHQQDVDTTASNNGSKEVDGVEKEQQEAAAALSPQERSARLIITALSCVAFLLLGALGGIIGPSVPALAADLGQRETKLAGIFTCRGLGFLTGSFSMTFLDGKIRKHVLMSLCTLVAGAVTFAVVYCQSLPALVALMYFQGLSLAGVVVTGNAVLVEVWGQQVDPYMQGLHAAFGVGAVLGPVAVGGLGYRPSYLVFSSLAIIPVLCVAMEEGRLLRWRRGRQRGGGEGRPEAEAEEAEAAENGEGKEQEQEQEAVVEQETETAAARKARLAAEAAEAERAKRGDLADIGWGFRGLMSLFLFLYTGSEVGCGGWVATVLLLDHLAASKEEAAFVVSVFWGALTAGRFISVPLALRLRPSRLLVLQLATTCLGALLLTLGGKLLSLPGVAAASALYGLGMSSIFPCMMSLPAEVGLFLDMPSTSHFLIGACLGEALVPLAIGYLMDRFGPRSFGWFLLATTLAMVVLFGKLLTMGAKKEGKKTGEKKGQGEEEGNGDVEGADGIGMGGGAGAGAVSAKELEEGNGPLAVSA